MDRPAHLATILPVVRHRLSPPAAPPAEAWSTTVDDPRRGPVRLTGELRREAGEALLVALHGLGGCSASSYMVEVAAAAAELGVSCLRLNLRGADRGGDDFYHAGLTADLGAALASPRLARFNAVYLLGNSLGGHLALRWATEAPDPRLRAVAAVCSPLALAPGAAALDAPGTWLYRRYVLASLKEIYAAVAARRRVPLAVEAARGIRHIREWDERVVAPHHGFADAADYYARASVAPRLGSLRVPALLLAAEGDPMVPAEVLRPWLGLAPERLTARWAPGGHLAFAADLDLGFPGPRGYPGQVLGWLLARR